MTEPIFVALINPKSGGKVGPELLQRFKEILNSENVHNLIEEGGPKPALQKLCDINKERKHLIRIVSCGGDGTTGWILSVMDAMNLPEESRPPIGIIPLGTGNDLSRVFNWGGKYIERPLEQVLRDMSNADLVKLDRWSIDAKLINGVGCGGGNLDVVGSEDCSEKDAANKLPMNVLNNYYSIGIDAYIAYKFHQARDKNPGNFKSRNRNRMYYALKASKDWFKPYWGNLMEFVSIVCDGVDRTEELKAYKANGILILNILSYAGGCRPWNTRDKAKNSMTDGMIEVIALDNYDLAALQMGCYAKSVCQCKHIVLTTSKLIHMKVDGEPVLMKPCTITIGLDREKAPPGNMLQNKNSCWYCKDEVEVDEAARKIQKCWRSHSSTQLLIAQSVIVPQSPIKT